MSAPATSWLLVILLAGTLLVTGCAKTNSATSRMQSSNDAPAVSADDTATAQAVLEEFFVSWQNKDATGVESRLSSARADGTPWDFRDLERLEVGTITPEPERVADYLSTGRGSVNGVSAEDVRVFRAPITFWWAGGVSAGSASGEELNWMWILIREGDGRWVIDDWGY